MERCLCVLKLCLVRCYIRNRCCMLFLLFQKSSGHAQLQHQSWIIVLISHVRITEPATIQQEPIIVTAT